MVALMLATGNYEKVANSSNNVNDLLYEYLVGTEKHKKKNT